MAARASESTRELAVTMCQRHGGPGGELSNELVHRIAEMCAVSERTVRRWATAPAAPRRSKARPTRCELDALAQCHGNMRAAHRLLVRNGYELSHSSFWRRLRHLPKGEYLGHRFGSAAVKNGTVQIRYDVGSKLGLGHFDHTEAPLEVRYRGRSVKPWITVLIDDHTRFVVATAVTIGDGVRGDPPTETIKAILVSGAGGRVCKDGVRYGGVFDAVMFDNARPHLANAIRDGLDACGTGAIPIRPGTPEHNGKVERFMWIAELEFFAEQYGFTHGNPDRWGHDKSLRSTDGLLTLDAFIGLWSEFIDHYNHNRVHGSLKSTPAEAWSADPRVPEYLDPELAKRFFAGGDETIRKITKNGISFRGSWYVHPDLNGYWTPETEDVQVKYLPNDSTFVDVYALDGAFVCRAYLPEYLDDDQRSRSFKLRESVAREINLIQKRSHARAKEEARRHNERFLMESGVVGEADAEDEFADFLNGLADQP